MRAEPVPEMADRVAGAMAAKYWTDLLVRFSSHTLTVRLSAPAPFASVSHESCSSLG